MKHCGYCPCGFETPLVENKEDVDWELLHAHQEFCKIAIKIKKEEQSSPTG